MAMRVFNVGDVLAAADVNEYLVNTRYVSKPNDQGRSNTTVLANDPDLTVAVDANKSYWVESVVQYACNSGVDLKYSWSVPASALFYGQTTNTQAGGYGAGGIDSVNPISNTFTSLGAGVFEQSIRLSGVLVVAGTAGNLIFRWAQNTSNAASTTLRAGSSMFLRRIA